MKNRKHSEDGLDLDVGWEELTWIYTESGSSVHDENGLPDMSRLGDLVRDSRANWRRRRRYRA